MPAFRFCARCAALLLAGLLLLPAPGAARPTKMSQLTLINNRLTRTNVPYGAIKALYSPAYMRIQEAELTLDPDDIVFVAELPDGPRIYPQRVMVWHQVVNERVKGHSYAVTYSPTSGTVAVYDSRLGGHNLMLDVEGSLFDANTIIVDRNTGSLWLQELGLCFDGPLIGRGLPMLPVYWTTWEAAKRVYPDAPVLATPSGRRPYGRDPYGEYRNPDSYYHNGELVYPVQKEDHRFPLKQQMLCFEFDGVGLTAVDVEYVKKHGAVNFFLGPLALLAVHDPILDVVRVFNRQVWIKPFLFRFIGGRLTDLSTNSIWDPRTGAAVEGALKGAAMQQHHGIYSMWFAWASINPETSFVPGAGEVDPNLLIQAAPGRPEILPGFGVGSQMLPTPGQPDLLPTPPSGMPPADVVEAPPAPVETAPAEPDLSWLKEEHPGTATGGLPILEDHDYIGGPAPAPAAPGVDAGMRGSTGARQSAPGRSGGVNGTGRAVREGTR